MIVVFVLFVYVYGYLEKKRKKKKKKHPDTHHYISIHYLIASQFTHRPASLNNYGRGESGEQRVLRSLDLRGRVVSGGMRLSTGNGAELT